MNASFPRPLTEPNLNIADANRPCEAAAASPAGLSAQHRWAAVILLMVVGILNYVDRHLPAIFAESMKHDLHLSDTALGFVNGFGFLVIYATMGIPIARIADRGRYGVVISTCLALWSVITMFGGLVQNALQLALSRVGVALGEAGSTPAAHAFIAQNFPPDRRAAPLAVLSLSVSLAALVGYVSGGLLGQAIGWRYTFLVTGGLSLLLAPLVLLVLGARSYRDPEPSGRSHTVKLPPLTSLLRKPSFVTILAASSMFGIGGYTLSAFAPAFLMRIHGMSVGKVGVEYGITSGIVGPLALLLTGFIADRVSRKDPRRLLLVVAALIGLALPCLLASLMVQNDRLSLLLMAIAVSAGTAYLPPVIASIQQLAPVETRASASAVLLFCTSMLGGLGPLTAGLISDALEPRLGAAALTQGMYVAPAAWTVAALLYLLATRRFREQIVAEPARA